MEEKIFEYVRKVAEKKGDIITRETDLYEDSTLDSLEIMCLLRYIQEDLGIAIPPEDLNFEVFLTVNSIIEFVKKYAGSTNE